MTPIAIPPPQFDPPALNPPPAHEVYSGPSIGNVDILILPPDNLFDPSDLGLGVQVPFSIW